MSQPEKALPLLARWHLRRTVRRLLDRRQPAPGSPKRAHRFHLYHFFRNARART